ncbi:MAG: hypothetical protein IH991_11970 [Planctomycetes bacterium]|nr:hypothetical protein [Planctomycetota bacterium]
MTRSIDSARNQRPTKRRFQFSTSILLALTAAISACFAVLQPLKGYWYLYTIMVVYAVAVAVYAVFRTAVLWRRYKYLRARTKSHRESLTELVAQRRASSKQHKE